MSRNILAVIKGIITNSLSYAVQPLGYIQSSPAIYVKIPSKRAETKIKTVTKSHIVIPQYHMQKLKMKQIALAFVDDCDMYIRYYFIKFLDKTKILL